jgi:hypothetical protein
MSASSDAAGHIFLFFLFMCMVATLISLIATAAKEDPVSPTPETYGA